MNIPMEHLFRTPIILSAGCGQLNPLAPACPGKVTFRTHILGYSMEPKQVPKRIHLHPNWLHLVEKTLKNYEIVPITTT